MPPLILILLITAIAGVGGTGLGGVIGGLCRKDSDKSISLLLSFAAGVMLSVVCFDLLEEAIFTGNSATAKPIPAILGVMLGYGVIALLNFIIDKVTNHEVPHITSSHPKAHDAPAELIHADHLQSHKERKTNLFMAGVIMVFAIALHNLPEGMAIGASYVAGDDTALLSGSGFLLAVVLGLHNIPEGMAVSVPLIAGGMSRGKAICITALSGAPTILGAYLGFYLGTLGPLGLTLSLGFASGAMLYVVLGELIPEAVLMWKSKLPALAILVGMLLGIMFIYT